MDLIQANFQSTIAGAPGEIVYLPEGRHKIKASVNGKPATREVIVDDSVLAAFATSLDVRNKANVIPILDFDHQKGKASARPQEFRYEPGKGLMLSVEWTKSGREAIEGKDYAYFSPEFLLDASGKPTGLPAHGAIGGLVNDPAFESITRIAAKRTEKTTTNQDTMSDLVKAGILSEAEAAKENAVQVAAHRYTSYKEDAELVAAARRETEQVKAELVTAQKERDDLLAELNKQKEDAAKAYVAAQVQAGRIAPKDEKAIAFWEAAVLRDDNAKAALEAMPASKIGLQVIKGSAGDRGNASENPIVQAAKAAQEKGESVSLAVQIAAKNNPEAYAEYRESLISA